MLFCENRVGRYWRDSADDPSSETTSSKMKMIVVSSRYLMEYSVGGTGRDYYEYDNGIVCEPESRSHEHVFYVDS